MKSSQALPPTADLPDDRITCETCENRNRDGTCSIRGFKPVARLMRCEDYRPNAKQQDRRSGRARWPHLTGQPPAPAGTKRS